MINMDQVRTLEMKVKQTVQLIVHLRRENDSLRGRLSDTEVRLQELETLLEGLKASQSEMESGIRSALQELDHLDDNSAPSVPSFAVAPEPVAEEDLVAESPRVLDSVQEDSVQEDFDESTMEESTIEESWSGTPSEEAMTEETGSEEIVAEETLDEPEPQQPGLGIF